MINYRMLHKKGTTFTEIWTALFQLFGLRTSTLYVHVLESLKHYKEKHCTSVIKNNKPIRSPRTAQSLRPRACSQLKGWNWRRQEAHSYLLRLKVSISQYSLIFILSGGQLMKSSGCVAVSWFSTESSPNVSFYVIKSTTFLSRRIE